MSPFQPKPSCPTIPGKKKKKKKDIIDSQLDPRPASAPAPPQAGPDFAGTASPYAQGRRRASACASALPFLPERRRWRRQFPGAGNRAQPSLAPLGPGSGAAERPLRSAGSRRRLKRHGGAGCWGGAERSASGRPLVAVGELAPQGRRRARGGTLWAKTPPPSLSLRLPPAPRAAPAASGPSPRGGGPGGAQGSRPGLRALGRGHGVRFPPPATPGKLWDSGDGAGPWDLPRPAVCVGGRCPPSATLPLSAACP